MVTIERQHEGFFDDVRDRKAATDFGLDLRVSLDPTSDSISQIFFNRIHRFAELGVVSAFDSDNDLLSVHPQIGFDFPRRAGGDARLFGLTRDNCLVVF